MSEACPIGNLEDYVERVLAEWRQGHDTLTIARLFDLRERAVYRIITAEQDRRYAARSSARIAEAAHA